MGAEKSALERLDEKRRVLCARAWQELLGAHEGERARALAGWRAGAANTLPWGLERLHPSWIVAALEGEPTHIRRLVLSSLPESLRTLVLGMPGMGSGGTMASATKREVDRVAFGWLAPLCEGECGPLAESLCSLSFDELLAELTHRGARTVGQSLAGAAPGLRARAMAAAGEPWAQIIGAASAESARDADRKIAMTHAHARIPDSARTPSERLLCIGLSVVKSELAAEHPGSIYRLAGRLPAALGQPLLGWECSVFYFGS